MAQVRGVVHMAILDALRNTASQPYLETKPTTTMAADGLDVIPVRGAISIDGLEQTAAAQIANTLARLAPGLIAGESFDDL